MYRKISIFLATIIILVGALVGCTNKTQNIETIQDLNSTETNSITEEKKETSIIINKEEVINKLCSDEFQGRWIGTLGNDLAGDYINDLFEQINLIPIFNEDYKEEYTQEVYKTSGLIAEDDYGEVKMVNNIVGKIEGTSNNAIIISAHFDHVGIQDGKIIKVPLIEKIPQRQICLVESKRTPLSIAANALKQFINNYIETKLKDKA